MNRTKIEWCDFTWNPVIGCRGGCPYCYARRMSYRFHIGSAGFLPEWNEHNFNRPFPQKPARIFVNSMSDVADWTDGWALRVFKRIEEHPEHLFLFLTKRPEAWRCVPRKNVLFGVSVTDQRSYNQLVSKIGPHNFLSIEPLLGPVQPWGFHSWIIVGAETGNRRGKVRPDVEWLDDIYNFAVADHVPLFFKESLRAIWTEDLDGEPAYFPQEYPA